MPKVEQNDGGNPSLRICRESSAVTRTLQAGHQRDPPRLGFPDPLPVPPFSQGCQKEGEGDLAGPRWAEGSKPFAPGSGLQCCREKKCRSFRGWQVSAAWMGIFIRVPTVPSDDAACKPVFRFECFDQNNTGCPRTEFRSPFTL